MFDKSKMKELAINAAITVYILALFLILGYALGVFMVAC